MTKEQEYWYNLGRKDLEEEQNNEWLDSLEDWVLLIKCEKWDEPQFYSRIRSDDAKLQYLKIHNREEIALSLGDEAKFYYCRNIEDKKVIRESIKSDLYIYKYLLHIKDREEMCNKLTDDGYKLQYWLDINKRGNILDILTDEEVIEYYKTYYEGKE